MYDLPVTLQDVNHLRRKRMGRDWPLMPTTLDVSDTVLHYAVKRELWPGGRLSFIPRGLREKVVALRQVHCLGRRCPAVPDCGFAVPREFQQMCPHRVQAVMFREARIVFEGVQQLQALRCTVHHRRRSERMCVSGECADLSGFDNIFRHEPHFQS